MFNLHHLRYFYICAQTGSITKAAARLGISQPSLSMQIKQFEAQIGAQVLVRSGPSLGLTPKGQKLMSYSARFFEVTGEIEHYLNQLEPAKELDLRIGVSEDVERPFVAEVLGRLVKQHHSKRLSSTILSRPQEDLIGLLNGKELDVIICTEKVKRGHLVAEFRIPVRLITADREGRSPISGKLNTQALLDTLGQTLILPMEQMALGQETRAFLKKQRMHSRTSLQSNILACIVRAVEEGVGAAFLPVAYVNEPIRRGTLKAFGPPAGHWQHVLYLFSQPGGQNEFLTDLAQIIRSLSLR